MAIVFFKYSFQETLLCSFATKEQSNVQTFTHYHWKYCVNFRTWLSVVLKYVHTFLFGCFPPKFQCIQYLATLWIHSIVHKINNPENEKIKILIFIWFRRHTTHFLLHDWVLKCKIHLDINRKIYIRGYFHFFWCSSNWNVKLFFFF